MARRSELARLALDDILETPKGLEVSIRRSKTDQDARGATVALPSSSNPLLDPVRLTRAWRDDLAARGVTTGALLRVIDRNGNLTHAMQPSSINTVVRRVVAYAQLPNPGTYSAHSLRAGGLTSALEAGVPLGVAAAHGRWSPKSPVVIQYARTADQWRDNAMRGVL
ncbi:MAG: integrase [Propionibacteriales bacterium]|nr:integrase [Propionibacteriales bacterium]